MREGTQAGGVEEEEAGSQQRRGRSRLPAKEPDVGLDPTMLGSRPELKADV